MASANDFDFILGTWVSQNRRYTKPYAPGSEGGEWQTFEAHHSCAKYLDGRLLIEHFEATFPTGERRLGITLRTFDPESGQWSVRWLDNRNPLDFSPTLGTFQDKIGLFYEEITSPDGQPLRLRISWDHITANSARWQQAFSWDNGATWDTNWIGDFTRIASDH